MLNPDALRWTLAAVAVLVAAVHAGRLCRARTATGAAHLLCAAAMVAMVTTPFGAAACVALLAGFGLAAVCAGTGATRRFVLDGWSASAAAVVVALECAAMAAMSAWMWSMAAPADGMDAMAAPSGSVPAAALATVMVAAGAVFAGVDLTSSRGAPARGR